MFRTPIASIGRGAAEKVFVFSTFFFVIHLNAQPLALDGMVCDAVTQEPLPFAHVLVEGTTLGAACDAGGRFRLTLPSGNGFLQVRYIGYQTARVPVSAMDRELRISLHLSTLRMQEIVVYADPSRNDSRSPASAIAVGGERVAKTSSAMPDVFRSLQMLPGVSANNEFDAKFNVRGGNYDENLVLINGTTVYEPFHIKEADNASIGIFNTDLMRKAEFIAGGFPARYGDRLSSVLNIEYREGNRERFSGSATVSLSHFDFLAEGPLGPAGSFIVGGRKSYVGYALRFIDFEGDVRPSFYDVQGVFSLRTGRKHKTLFQFVHAGDRFELKPYREIGPTTVTAGTYLGRAATTTRGSSSFEENRERYFSSLADIQHRILLSGSAILQADLSLYDQIDDEYSTEEQTSFRDIRNDRFYFNRSVTHDTMDNRLRIQTWEAKAALDLKPSAFLDIKAGTSLQIIRYRQNLLDVRYRDVVQNMDKHPDTLRTHVLEIQPGQAFDTTRMDSYKTAAFLESIWQIGPAVTLDLGLRTDYFDINRDWNLSPRLSLLYLIPGGYRLQAAWGRYTQSPIYRQLAFSGESRDNPQAQKAVHWLIGLEKEWSSGETCFTLKTEAYIKKYNDLISSTRSSYGRITYSRHNDAEGLVRGIDAMTSFKWKRVSGWLSAGWLSAKENLESDGLGSYPRYTDQRYTFAFLGEIRLGRMFEFSTRAAYGSGYAYTPYTAVYNANTKRWTWVTGYKNDGHLPAYRRLDIRTDKTFRIRNVTIAVFLDVNNLFNFKNIQSFHFHLDAAGKPYREEIKLWPIVPMLGVRVGF